MAERRPDPDAARLAAAEADDGSGEGLPEPVQRRAPFADNPNVGVRGQRTQQRILDAALELFGELGYHGCSIDRIAKRAGCSRVSFYQYFSSREDVFRHLAGQVARQRSVAIEALPPLTPDQDGWDVTRGWIARQGDVYERFEPVFRVFQAAAERDEAVAGGSVRVTERALGMFRSKLATTELASDRVEPVLRLLMEVMTRTNDVAAILRRVVPDAYPRDRVEEVLTDVVHRTLFGSMPDVNVHPPVDGRPRSIQFSEAMQRILVQEEVEPQLTDAGRRTLEALVGAGRDQLVRRGYHGTRVDDIVTAAELSHGAFYRYFKNKDELAHVLAVRAIREVSTAFASIPAVEVDGDEPQPAALRDWLGRYTSAYADQAAMIRVWVDVSAEPELAADSAAAFDWGRRQMARFLRPRGFGDVDLDGVVMVALIGALGNHTDSTSAVDAGATIIERGLLGR